jgi:hypothetical protein
MNKLNLSQRKLNKKEVEFLIWFLSISNDNPIENPVEDTVFSYDDVTHSAAEFKNLFTKLKAIHKSYI